MRKVRHDLDATDRRITAVLLASPRASWRSVAEVLGRTTKRSSTRWWKTPG
ncbi:hypothetical protein SAMN04490356_7426 [Streptomyces melanosporofaciens]|uniref:Uncharacterized protein n=1 Tax=Streptomyces melanosporofaciens TaxID=67327 RepID=A0A1H4YUL5_STRMJ|nr:hypothetical protein SAMN04490356_7426 [Streptomyces melanosporofaciens]